MNKHKIDVDKLELAFKKATERAIKIHNALDVPFITAYNGKIVEMSHNKVIRVIKDENLSGL